MRLMCCTKHPVQAAKQTLRRPNEKAQHTQVSRLVTKRKQDREQNIVRGGRVLNRAMSKHDPEPQEQSTNI